MNLLKQITSSRKNIIMLVLICLGISTIAGLESHKKALLSPGDLTTVNHSGDEINGYVSHAEFEDDCGHCHGPIHCVIDTRCQDCHKEVAQERASDSGLHGYLPGTGDCETCHTEHKGKEAVITTFAYANIDHQFLAGFSLVKHNLDFDNYPMNCESCHSQKRFVSETLDCVTCHAAEDHNALAAHIDTFGSDCVACHDGADRYSDFEHAQVYPLDGEHQDLDCADCHQDQTFAGLPQDCHSCHEEPIIHAGIFGVKCERCHTATAWLPAELKTHNFLIDHADDGTEISCETCHELTYTQYPCYSCHDSGEMKAYHDKEGIYAYENCIDCHPTGRENEGTQYIETGFLFDAATQD
ncbi:MAG: hypothetical protein MUP90_16060 [Gammaproteobacteria bacterium]|nr:hypothetical protein [Gammaproteobacteria bacterium]